MDSNAKYTLSEAQLLFAKQANGETWKLLEKEDLSEAEQDLLLYTAFASSYHWNSVGDMVNKLRGEWLISRAFSHLKRGESALFHANRCFALTQSQPSTIKDFDFAYASEAMARSFALVDDFNNAEPHYKKAIQLGNKILNEKDRELFIADLQGGYWNGFEIEK